MKILLTILTMLALGAIIWAILEYPLIIGNIFLILVILLVVVVTTYAVYSFLEKIFPIFIICCILMSCSKDKIDYSYYNTDRRPQITLVSERFTNPPKWADDEKWLPDSVVYHHLNRSIDTAAYSGRKPDTLRSTCPVFGPNLYIEVSYYTIKTFRK